jgi:hypothetical protein
MDWNLVSLTYTDNDPTSPVIGISAHPSHRQSSLTPVSLIRRLKMFISAIFSPTVHQPPLLRFRRHLHFSHRIYYVGAMLIDFILRTTWSLKLSSHLSIKKLEGSILLMEFFEIFRRWVWVFFRLESEWVKRAQYALPRSQSNEEYELVMPKEED